MDQLNAFKYILYEQTNKQTNILLESHLFKTFDIQHNIILTIYKRATLKRVMRDCKNTD